MSTPESNIQIHFMGFALSTEPPTKFTAQLVFFVGS
ncbi:hypothetical protein P872_08635 [Rhodonellum psychrophilum GCM71 = DSM 17998]|uniref:Uncharacterized protein n=1 Tax=Rhodonellum psychrophilum GCM71 = DSM 17998 TaxID=1123057 RepID=U5BNB7_9BACT|nr:hypothetical protein P872_08635 [Rhodonellum psychrophilum GCM71 = DSM 17998]